MEDYVDHRPDICQAIASRSQSAQFGIRNLLFSISRSSLPLERFRIPKMSMSVRLSCSSDDSDTVHLQILGLDGTRMDVAVPWLHLG